MSAVETLGAATVIASDKTGTITKNEMRIIHCYLNGQNFTVTGTGYEPKGQLLDLESHVLNKNNLAELTVFLLGFAAVFWQMPIAILAVNILVIDLIGNMLPLLMLTFDPAEEDLMHRPPRRLGEMLNKKAMLTVLYSCSIKGIISFSAFLFSFFSHSGHPQQHESAMTVTLTSITFCQFVNIFSSRTRCTVFTRFFFSNHYLFLGIGLSALFVFLLSYLLFCNRYFRTGPLEVSDWVIVLGGAFFYLAILESLKYFSRKKRISNPVPAE